MGKTLAELMSENISNALTNVKTWGGVIYNVKEFGAAGNGIVDDTKAFQKAMNTIREKSGGILYIPGGTYLIESTLTIDERISIVGESSATVTLKWGGDAKSFIHQTNRIIGITIGGFRLDGNNKATVGIDIERLRNTELFDMAINGFTEHCMKIVVRNPESSDDNIMWNIFRGLHLSGAPVPLFIDGVPGSSNVCHNLFINLRIDFSGDYGIYLGNSDNNSFLMTWIFRRFGSGTGVYLSSSSRSNYFFHLQASSGGVTAVSNANAAIFGYDRENGQPTPVVDATAQLMWTENGNNATTWKIMKNISRTGIALQGNTFTNNNSAEEGAFKFIGFGATGNDLGHRFFMAMNPTTRRMEFHHTPDGSSPVMVMDFRSTNVRLQVPLVLPVLTSAPSNPVKGTVYFDNATNKIKFYNGSGWETVTSS